MSDALEGQTMIPMASAIPGRTNVLVRVEKSEILQAWGDAFIPYTLKLKDAPFADRSRADEYGEFLFAYDEDGAEAYHHYIFVEPRTEAQTLVALPSLSTPEVIVRPWHNCLLKFGAIEDATQPVTIELDGDRIQVARLFERYHHLPGGNYATKIQKAVYVSAQPFDLSRFILKTPVPTTVSWNHRNISGSINCLHGDISFPETQTNGTVLPNWGTVKHPISMRDTQFFPKTSPDKWTDYVFDLDHKPVAGMHRLTLYTCYPPEGARTILNAVS